MKQILLTTNTFSSYKRQDLAVQKMHLLQNKNANVKCALIQFEEEQTSYEDYPIDKLRVLKRSSKSDLKVSKQLPYIKDLFDVSRDYSEDIFVFSNSDIILSQKLINYINNNDIEAVGISRIDISPIEDLTQSSTIIRMEPAGFDTWVVSKKWWTKHSKLFPDMLLGRPEFDVVYTALMDLNSKNTHISTEYLTYHPMHEIVSFTKDECYHYNIKFKENQYKKLFDWWGNICNQTYLSRPDWGSFLKFLPDEKEIISNIIKEHKVSLSEFTL